MSELFDQHSQVRVEHLLEKRARLESRSRARDYTPSRTGGDGSDPNPPSGGNSGSKATGAKTVLLERENALLQNELTTLVDKGMRSGNCKSARSKLKPTRCGSAFPPLPNATIYAVRATERQLMEIAQLQQVFSAEILRQYEQVEAVYNDAVHATGLPRSCRCCGSLLWVVVVGCCCGLLFVSVLWVVVRVGVVVGCCGLLVLVCCCGLLVLWVVVVGCCWCRQRLTSFGMVFLCHRSQKISGPAMKTCTSTPRPMWATAFICSPSCWSLPLPSSSSTGTPRDGAPPPLQAVKGTKRAGRVVKLQRKNSIQVGSANRVFYNSTLGRAPQNMWPNVCLGHRSSDRSE